MAVTRVEDLFAGLDYDRQTRACYAAAATELAQWSGQSPQQVVERALALASEYPDRDARLADLGAYLIAEGRPLLERALGCRVPAGIRLRRAACRSARIWFLLVLFGLAAALLVGAAMLLRHYGASTTRIVLVVIVITPVCYDSAHEILSRLVVRAARAPAPLPKYELAAGIPAGHATLVVQAVILHDPDEVGELLATLEANYLANTDPALTYCIVTDLHDAAQQELPTDAAIIACVDRGIEDLNRRHPGTPFQHYHRRRTFNSTAGRWMAWERKRGKLVELNRLIRGADPASSSFSTAHGDFAVLRRARYVIALDADTLLLPGTATRLVGTLAHPLNRPRLDHEGRVRGGHAVLQPRCARRPWGNTRLSILFFDVAPQPFDAAPVPMVHRILFGEGAFFGKGIYDVEAFERSCDGRFPNDWVLSHDKLEGMFARAGIVSEIVLFESAPTRVATMLKRAHRWTRGDYQILPWALPWVPTARGWARSPLPAVDRWRVIHDLVMPLRFPSLLGLLLLAWFGLVPGGPILWTVLALSKPIVMIGARMMMPIKIVPWLVMLPALTWVALDAAVRGLFRITPIGRAHALEWTTAARAERISATAWSTMRPVAMFGACVGGLLAWRAPSALIPAAPLVIGWLLAPALARWLGQLPAGEVPGESIDSFINWCAANKRPITSREEAA